MVGVHGGGIEASGEEKIKFTILHTNDEHSAIIPHSPAVDYLSPDEQSTVGGFARLATAIEQIRNSTEEPVLLMSGGDFLGGGPFSWLALSGHAIELELMQLMGYDFAVIGNHEFDYGPDIFAEYLKAAGYPDSSSMNLLSANVKPPDSHPLLELGIQPWYVHDLDGSDLSIGIFGLLGEHAQTVVADAGEVKFEDSLSAAEEAVQQLHNAGADLIIALTHSGLDEDKQLAREVDGVDLIVGGHCHTLLAEPIFENETLIVQTGSLLENMGILQLAYNRSNHSLRLRNHDDFGSFTIKLDNEFEEHPMVKEQVQEVTSSLNDLVSELTAGKYDDIYQVVTLSDFKIENSPSFAETPMGNLVADAMLEAVERAKGQKVDAAFQASGQIRGSLFPGSTSQTKGQISVYEVLERLGLGVGPDNTPGYPVVSLYLTGAELRNVLEISAILTELMGNSFFLQVSGLRTEMDLQRAVAGQLPILDVPVPTYRAVLEAEVVRTDIDSTDDTYIGLLDHEEKLFHVVSDYYVASFIPMVGEMLPRLAVEPKDEKGRPLKDLTHAVVHDDEGEVKVWKAVLDYLDEMDRVPDKYAASEGRIEQVTTLSGRMLQPASLVFLLLAAGGLLGLWVVKKRRNGA